MLESTTNSLEDLRARMFDQHAEIGLLQSIYPTELVLEEKNIMEVLENFLEGRSNEPPAFIDFTMTVTSECRLIFDMNVTFNQDYPNALPDIYVRNTDMGRHEISNLNKGISNYIQSLPRGEPCIFSAITWLKENAVNYNSSKEMKKDLEESKVKSEKVVRFWIYSHHIYNKTKRRDIQNLAGRFNITGFCMPGKPGVICVEGYESNCIEWWATIRGMPWQKIMLKATEDVQTRCFQKFQEVAFPTSVSCGTHSNLGQLYKYLEEHNVAFIFKELFGIEGGK